LQKNGAKGAFVVGMSENIREEYIEDYAARGIVSFYGIDEALHATEIAADISTAWQRETAAAVLPAADIQGPGMTLDEAEAKRRLAEHGVPIPAGGSVDSVEAAQQLATRLGYPVVLKALGIAHKTEHNAVRLNLRGERDIDQAARELFALSDRLYLEAMKSAQTEILVGVIRDPKFGLALTIGSGGILVELLRDTVTLLIPASPAEIETALNSLKSAPLLNGYRGRPRADIDAAVQAIVAIQEFAIAHSDSLLELDVNPLLIGAQDEGVFAADALIVIQEQDNV
jgi:acyl-CoA synthetase (NDP forming)